MSFAARPPEITSGLMYTGPGAGPMIAAATAWDALAAELQDTAASYGAIIEGLVNDGWTGPSSGAMAAAVAPYVSWMSATATQAKAAGEQAKAAVSAYETAYAAVVPPAEIALNRSELAQPGGHEHLRAEHRCDCRPRGSTGRCGPRTPPRCSVTPTPRPPRPS